MDKKKLDFFFKTHLRSLSPNESQAIWMLKRKEVRWIGPKEEERKEMVVIVYEDDRKIIVFLIILSGWVKTQIM